MEINRRRKTRLIIHEQCKGREELNGGKKCDRLNRERIGENRKMK